MTRIEVGFVLGAAVLEAGVRVEQVSVILQGAQVSRSQPDRPERRVFALVAPVGKHDVALQHVLEVCGDGVGVVKVSLEPALRLAHERYHECDLQTDERQQSDDRDRERGSAFRLVSMTVVSLMVCAF